MAEPPPETEVFWLEEKLTSTPDDLPPEVVASISCSS
jgi:hypothetical protein